MCVLFLDIKECETERSGFYYRKCRKMRFNLLPENKVEIPALSIALNSRAKANKQGD